MGNIKKWLATLLATVIGGLLVVFIYDAYSNAFLSKKLTVRFEHSRFDPSPIIMQILEASRGEDGASTLSVDALSQMSRITSSPYQVLTEVSNNNNAAIPEMRIDFGSEQSYIFVVRQGQFQHYTGDSLIVRDIRPGEQFMIQSWMRLNPAFMGPSHNNPAEIFIDSRDIEVVSVYPAEIDRRNLLLIGGLSTVFLFVVFQVYRDYRRDKLFGNSAYYATERTKWQGQKRAS